MPTRVRATAPLVAAVLVGAVAALGACTAEEPGEQEPTPEEVLADAKEQLDETSGVALDLVAEDFPEDLSGLVAADGVATHAPAFEGTLTVVVQGATVDVPVVAVDDAVHAELPLVPGWTVLDPAEYNAPDPAALLDPESGFSSLLPATEDLEQGETVRGGEDNDEVLTEYTGVVPGEAVTAIIPSAEGEFDATFSITDDGQLREMTLAGEFYPDTESLTYRIGFDDYGTDRDIVAP
jgi:lipoprotein LprG